MTVCTKHKENLFGTIRRNILVFNKAGSMIQSVWDKLPDHFGYIKLDQFIIMPNHIHGIIFLVGAPLVGALSSNTAQDNNKVKPDNTRAGTRPAPTLGNVVGIFKSISTHQYALNVHSHNWPPFPGKLWQRNYYEHIIRNEDELNQIREYIRHNPLRWDEDENNPINFEDIKTASGQINQTTTRLSRCITSSEYLYPSTFSISEVFLPLILSRSCEE